MTTLKELIKNEEIYEEVKDYLALGVVVSFLLGVVVSSLLTAML